MRGGGNYFCSVFLGSTRLSFNNNYYLRYYGKQNQNVSIP